MDEEYNEEESYFLLIKDSNSKEAEIIKLDYEFNDLIDTLTDIIKNENLLIEKENNRPNSLMESKHSDFRIKHTLYEEVDTLNNKELIRYTNGEYTYRIEEIR